MFIAETKALVFQAEQALDLITEIALINIPSKKFSWAGLTLAMQAGIRFSYYPEVATHKKQVWNLF